MEILIVEIPRDRMTIVLVMLNSRTQVELEAKKIVTSERNSHLAQTIYNRVRTVFCMPIG